MHIHELLAHTVKAKASDLHIATGEVPALRVDGSIRRVNTPPVSAEMAERLIYSIMTERQKTTFDEQLELDFSFGLPGIGRFRVNAFHQLHGLSAAFRALPDEVMALDELGLPPVVKDVTRLRRGLVLVTGPTGSGKTTTLAALIHEINQTRHEHVVTIEDPIEYSFRPARCIISQRELTTHTHSFTAALRSALREDPDVILLGEMRDLETISLALTAAETGHLVLSTLHTRSAADTVSRVIDAFPTDQQSHVRNMIANSLEAVVCQQLVPRKRGGRVCATEVLLINFAVRNLIRENKVFQIPSMMQTQTTAGMVTMEQSLLNLFRNGVITKDMVLKRSNDPAVVEKVEDIMAHETARMRGRR